MLLRYRGGEGMLAWAFHRISGVAIWLFVVLHVIDIFLVGAAPDAYDTLLFIYATPPGIIMEWLLGAAVLYHALNGLRIVLVDFWSKGPRYQKQMLWTVVGLWVVLMLGAIYPVLGHAARELFGS